MSTENLNSGEAEALATARLGDLRKKVNAESWSDNMENLMKQWGEKAAGLRFMHAHSGGQWKAFANKLAITGIVVTGVASTLSLIATSVEDQDVKDGTYLVLVALALYPHLFNPSKNSTMPRRKLPITDQYLNSLALSTDI